MLCRAWGRGCPRTGREKSKRRGVKVTLIMTVGLMLFHGSAAQDQGASRDFEKCRVIANDQARLTCLKGLLLEAEPTPQPAHDSWQLIRTPNPARGPDAVSVMRTADTSKSDPDLAGLIIRCEEKQGVGVSLAVVRPIPPRSKREVVVVWETKQSLFQAEASSAGTALNLPIEATMLARDAWQRAKELAVTIKDAGGEIHGVIPIDGLAPAIARLSVSCPN